MMRKWAIQELSVKFSRFSAQKMIPKCDVFYCDPSADRHFAKGKIALNFLDMKQCGGFETNYCISKAVV
jgi:hypothetical protein